MCRLIRYIVLCAMFLDYVCSYINLSDTECGLDTSRNARIVGGVDSLPNEIPWAASIWRQGAHQCGATVLNNQWLLTAGHCVCNVFDEFYKTKQLTVVVGHNDISTKIHNEELSDIIPHPNYRCNKKLNDVALLKTTRALKWSRALRPACLPQLLASDFSGTSAIVAGWGFTNEDRGKGDRPDILQKTDVMVLENDLCNRWYESQGSKVKVIGTQMCAGYENGGRDSCWADSGGPLLIRGESGRFLVVGIVSTGSGCARVKTPGIYTRVSKYSEWIENSINSDNVRSSLRWYPRSI